MGDELARVAWWLETKTGEEAFSDYRLFHQAMRLETVTPRGRNLQRVQADYEAGASIEDAISANVPNESEICGPAELEMTWAEWDGLAWAFMAHNWRTLQPEDLARVRHRMDIWAGVAVPETDEEVGEGDIETPEAAHHDPGTHSMRG